MTLGASLFLIAIGAILYFAVSAEVAGISIDTVGVILMVVGGVGFLLSLLFWSSFAPFRRTETTRTTTQTTDDQPPTPL